MIHLLEVVLKHVDIFLTYVELVVQITLHNYFPKGTKDSFVRLSADEVKLIRDKDDNLFTKYLIYIKYYCGYTKDNKYIEIELKRRNINIHTFKTIIIEPYKLQYAKEHADSIQLYVNFTNDDYIIVFNLHKITNIQKRQYNIPSKLYERVKTSFRYELPIQNAWIYKKQNNVYKCVKKGS